jgi:hypothetical protein
MAVTKGSGAVVMWRWSTIAPLWSRMQTDIVRACKSIPQYKGCGGV